LTTSPPGAGTWIERYEALRAYAVGEGRLAFRPLGLAVLRHRGVAAWMEVESRVMERGEVCRHVPSIESGGAEPAPAPARSELVSLLASTALLVAAGGQR